MFGPDRPQKREILDNDGLPLPPRSPTPPEITPGPYEFSERIDQQLYAEGRAHAAATPPAPVEQHIVGDDVMIGNEQTKVEDLKVGHLVIWKGRVYQVARTQFHPSPYMSGRYVVTLANTDGTMEFRWHPLDTVTTVWAVHRPITSRGQGWSS